MKIRTLVFAIVAVVTATGMTQVVGQTTKAREDCVSYNPSTLRLTDEGERGWLISRDDGARFIGLDTREDAAVILDVFKAHREFCYVGRDNKRANRNSYVHHYWK
jgi:hypothetical protein